MMLSENGSHPMTSKTSKKEETEAFHVARTLKRIAEGGDKVLVDRLTVRKLCGNLSNATLYRLPDFPKPVSVSRGRRAWVLSEVQNWIGQRIADRDRFCGEAQP